MVNIRSLTWQCVHCCEKVVFLAEFEGGIDLYLCGKCRCLYEHAPPAPHELDLTLYSRNAECAERNGE